MIGFGLCDGATALALFGKAAGLDALILVNPWLVEAEADAPPPAAIRAHYRKRLLSLEGWKKILSGAVDYRKLLKGLRKIFATRSGLAAGARGGGRAARKRPARLADPRRGGCVPRSRPAQELKAPAFDGLVEGGRS